MTDDSQRPDDRNLPEGDQPESLDQVGDASPAEDRAPDNDASEETGDPAELELSAASESSDDESEWDDDGLDEDELALVYAEPDGEFPDYHAQRLGRRGFLIGLAAAGVPVVGLVRVMDKVGGDKPTVAAPALQESPAATATSESALHRVVIASCVACRLSRRIARSDAGRWTAVWRARCHPRSETGIHRAIRRRR